MFYRALIITVSVCLGRTDSASAQLFSPLPGGQARSNLENAGNLSGDRRFLRQNVRRGDFVGRSPDAAQGFVGQSQAQATGRVQTAVSTLREEPPPPVNTPRRRRRSGIYEPRLTIGFEADRLPAADRAQQIQASVSQSLESRFRAAIEVSLNDGTATLRGEVDSAAARELAILVAQFEPGVEHVESELTVAGPPVLPAPADSR